jgi:hypothetical protein
MTAAIWKSVEAQRSLICSIHHYFGSVALLQIVRCSSSAIAFTPAATNNSSSSLLRWQLHWQLLCSSASLSLLLHTYSTASRAMSDAPTGADSLISS